MRVPAGLRYFRRVRIGKDSLRVPVVGYGWVRVLPLFGAVVTVGLLHVPEMTPSGWDWFFALTAAMLTLAGGVRPLTVTVLQAVVLVAAVPTTAALGVVVAQILVSVALGELAFRRRGVPLWCGVVVAGIASGVAHFDGYSVAANVLNTVLEVGLPLLLGSYLRSQRELAAQAEQRAVEADRSRALAANAARVAERTEVARELHDVVAHHVVAHHVAAIVLRVGVVRDVVPAEDPRIGEAMDDVHAIASEALTDLRQLVSVLRDPGLAERTSLIAASDLAAALDALVARTRQAGVDVRTDIDTAAVDRLDSGHRHAVLRLVQEGLTNVLKHCATSTTARVAIARSVEGRVSVTVSDDGGAPMGAPSFGHGLTVMRERVELLDGTFTVGPDDNGWRMHAELPVSEVAA